MQALAAQGPLGRRGLPLALAALSSLATNGSHSLGQGSSLANVLAQPLMGSADGAPPPQTRGYAAEPPPGGKSEDIDFGFKQVPRDAKQSLVAQVFSSVADSYDVMNDLMSGGLHRLWKDRLVEVLRPFAGMRHLDVAGGTGDVAFRVLRAIRAAEVEDRLRGSRRAAAPAAAAAAPAGAAGGRPAAGQAATRGSAQPKATTSDAAGPGPSSGGSSSVSGSATAPAAAAAGASARPAGAGGAAGTASSSSGSSSSSPLPVSPGSVVVCDINPDMLRVGRKKADSTPDLAGDSGLSFVEGNAEALPFADESFDAYTIAFGIRNVTDRPAALREALRVLKRGGRLLVLEFSRVEQPQLRQLYDTYSFNVIPAIGAAVAHDADSYRYLVESIRRFPDQESFKALIQEAGFQAVTYDNLMGGVVAIHSGFKL